MMTSHENKELVSGRHAGAHPDGHQHGGSIQISINLGKTFLRISCIRKIAVTWNLARVFAYSPSFFSQNLVFIYWMLLIFISIAWHWKPAINIYTPKKYKETKDKNDNITWSKNRPFCLSGLKKIASVTSLILGLWSHTPVNCALESLKIANVDLRVFCSLVQS